MTAAAAMGDPRPAGEMLRVGADAIVASWRSACTADALGDGRSSRDDELTADRGQAVVTATGPAVVASLATLVEPDENGWPPASSVAEVATALADNGFGVGPLVRQLNLLRQVLHVEARRRLPATVVADAEHELDLALDKLVEACAVRAAERLERDAFVDPLTGLLNRRALERDLAREVAAAQRRGSPLSLLTADVDGLKKVNDRQGHTMGDEALRAVAGALRAALRGSDSAYRVGGDEFVVLLPEMGREAVSKFVGRVRASAPPSFSCGAATFPDEVTNPSSLLDLADRRLLDYRAAEGRGRPVTADEAVVAGSVGSSRTPAPRRSRGSLVAAAFLGGLLLGGASLASAATGSLPGPMQEMAHSVLTKVGVPIPSGKTSDRAAVRRGAQPVSLFEVDAAGRSCTYPDGSSFTGTHGQYVTAHPDQAATPQNERELAAQSRCGRPTRSGEGGEHRATPGSAGSGEQANTGGTERPSGAGPGDSGGPGDTAGPGDTRRPSDTAGAADTAGPGDTGRPGDTGQPGGSGPEPSGPAQRENPAQPGNVENRGTPPSDRGRPAQVDGPARQEPSSGSNDKAKARTTTTIAATPPPTTAPNTTTTTTTVAPPTAPPA